MIIGYEAKRVYHNASGLGNYSRNLIRLMAQFHPENSYYLYNPSEGPLNFGEFLEGVEEKRPVIKNRLYRNIWRQRLLSDRARRDKVDVFHGLSMELPQGLHKKKIPSVVTVHDVIFLRYPELYRYIDRKIYLKKLRSACKRADLIVATSQQTKNDLVEYLQMDPEWIKVAYQGVHPIFWTTFNDGEQAEVQQRFDLPERFGLFVGTLETRKGADKILNAQLETGIPVVYIGKSTPFWEETLSLAKYNPIRHLIHTPEVPLDEDLAKIYRLAKVFIYPSLFEGFGIPVLEALITSTPVITSNRSSLPEVAGPSSILINPEEQEELTQALRRVWESPELQEKMMESGLSFAENFRDENIANHWQKIYRSLKA
ncbi:MAG: glycosyltransferase family 1 protein [Owenweeksia sp.]|nr:glycosyltransferase family 1 protein [Owenweeksia sp.]